MRKQSWPSWAGEESRIDKSIICLYVDDFMKRHWAEIGRHIEFKEDAALLARYLGANYNIDKFSLKEPKRARQIRVSITNYLLALVARFQDDHPDAKLYPVTSPFCRRRSGPMPMTSQECTRLSVRAMSRVLSLHLWLAGRAKVDHEGHSVDCS